MLLAPQPHAAGACCTSQGAGKELDCNRTWRANCNPANMLCGGAKDDCAAHHLANCDGAKMLCDDALMLCDAL